MIIIHFIEAMEKRIDELEEIVKTLLTPRVQYLEVSEEESKTKIDMLIKHTKENVTKILETVMNSKESFKCRECEEIYSKKGDLRLHVKECHAITFKCKICDGTFDLRWKLENHLKEEHETRKEFKCDICSKEFVMKWRLNRHVRAHSDIDQKFCHYYNNEKNCPYEEVGCKFQHEQSEMCNSGRMCKSYLCQFRHAIYVMEDKSIDNGEYKNLNLNDKLDECKENRNDDKSEALEDALVKMAC